LASYYIYKWKEILCSKYEVKKLCCNGISLCKDSKVSCEMDLLTTYPHKSTLPVNMNVINFYFSHAKPTTGVKEELKNFLLPKYGAG
jgi:hypothetical protein